MSRRNTGRFVAEGAGQRTDTSPPPWAAPPSTSPEGTRAGPRGLCSPDRPPVARAAIREPVRGARRGGRPHRHRLREPVPDREDSAAPIARRSLEPLFENLYEALAGVGAAAAAPEVLRLVAEAYALGHRDGARHAVADIAPVAAAHGL